MGYFDRIDRPGFISTLQSLHFSFVFVKLKKNRISCKPSISTETIEREHSPYSTLSLSFMCIYKKVLSKDVPPGAGKYHDRALAYQTNLHQPYFRGKIVRQYVRQIA